MSSNIHSMRFNTGDPQLKSLRPIRWIRSLYLTLSLTIAIAIVFLIQLSIEPKTTIIIITPTHARRERMADMTRLSQTLQHIDNIHWIVIEDSNRTNSMVSRLLERSGINHVYFFTTTKPGMQKRGWTHRNLALRYIRVNYKNYNLPTVIYFADDDNSYDVRLFNDYIRNVKTVGVWAVGLVGGALVEAPFVENGKITRWHAVYALHRKFVVDMAGFAVNLKLILRYNAILHDECGPGLVESCFLSQLNISVDDAQPFGHDRHPKEILVWHTKSHSSGWAGGSFGYEIE